MHAFTLEFALEESDSTTESDEPTGLVHCELIVAAVGFKKLDVLIFFSKSTFDAAFGSLSGDVGAFTTLQSNSRFSFGKFSSTGASGGINLAFNDAVVGEKRRDFTF